MASDLLRQLPDNFGTWPPLWKATTLFLATFVLEDLAAVAAGVLLATGILDWSLAFGACFLGIWGGDAGLYGLARVFGRNCFERSSLRKFSQQVEQSERWFAKRGEAMLVFSRVLPGTRLPTYLAAGFLRLPAGRFLLVTGLASLLWTGFILLGVRFLGAGLTSWLAPLKVTSWILITSLTLAFLAARFLNKRSLSRIPRRLKTSLERWTHWEFWPAWLFYPPVALYCLWLGIKHRGLAVPTAANPGIFSGGLVGESKWSTLRSLMESSPDFTCETQLISGVTVEQKINSLRKICSFQQLGYPLILKPDVGQRGAGVKLIHSEEQARDYLAQTHGRILAQRYAPGPHEVGVFYYRFPGEEHGHIFAITEKVFPVITGDGRATIEDLVWADPRARFLADKYLQRLAGRQNEILAPGQSVKLVEAGNHAQGCIFRDGMRLNTARLWASIDAISRKVPGFYIGRYDIRYGDEQELKEGRNFKIVELNGAASEATSIYDPSHTLWAAYQKLFRQWRLVFAIGAHNRRNGATPTPLRILWRTWRDYLRHAATYPPAD